MIVYRNTTIVATTTTSGSITTTIAIITTPIIITNGVCRALQIGKCLMCIIYFLSLVHAQLCPIL